MKRVFTQGFVVLLILFCQLSLSAQSPSEGGQTIMGKGHTQAPAPNPNYDSSKPINQGNLPAGVTFTVNSTAPANPIDAWTLANPAMYAGNWSLNQLSLEGQQQIGARPKADVMPEVQADFPLGSSLLLQSSGAYTLQLNELTIQGTAGVANGKLVLESNLPDCASCSNRLALDILSQNASQLILGLPLQDQDTPYTIQFQFSQSTTH